MRTAIREYRWRLADQPDAQLVTRLSQEINVPEPIARILINRGIVDYDKARLYFRPAVEHLHDPFLLNGMEAAVRRLTAAIESRERIVVFGDYDVDGTNGAAMLYLTIDDDKERLKKIREFNFKLLRLNIMRKRPFNLDDLPDYEYKVADKLTGGL